MKRTLDIVAASVLLLLASPLILLLAAAIRLDSGGPVLFRAQRVGRAGREFTMYKLRSMAHDAESRLAEVAHLNCANGMVKIPADPRVTRVGRLLRRFSLDEIPQLWNVLKGDMSLVGPRPHDLSEVRDGLVAGDTVLHERLSMRPGLSGIWQVTARADPSLAVRIRCDLSYVRRWSLWLDMRLLFATIPAVLLGQGGQVAIAGAPSSRYVGEEEPSRPGDVAAG